MAEQLVIFEQRAAVGVITLNRPEKLNALTNPMIDELIGLVEKAALDDSLRCLVISGAGRAFCSGDDMGGMGDLPRPVPPHETYEAAYQLRLIGSLRALQKPVIASIHGYCYGMGQDMAMACDLRIAAEGTRFGEPRVLRGMHITTGATYLLPRLVGLPKAMELLLSGTSIDADEALAIGLVTRVVPADRLEQETMALASDMAAGPTKAYGFIKAQVYAEFDMDLREAVRDMEYWRRTPIADRDEGVRAFFEKRPPKFSGR